MRGGRLLGQAGQKARHQHKQPGERKQEAADLAVTASVRRREADGSGRPTRAILPRLAAARLRGALQRGVQTAGEPHLCGKGRSQVTGQEAVII